LKEVPGELAQVVKSVLRRNYLRQQAISRGFI